ncbi:hypothetical protein MMC31_003113 [Peltigera leucophlebia]|nr:hypothetical protein [Peltigera leucophlebia]
MKTPEPRKVSRNIAESHLADYSEMNEDEPLTSLPDGKPQMEDRPSSTDSVYDLGSTRLLLRPSSGPPSGSMTSATTESTIWTSQASQSSWNGDSFTTSFGLSESMEASDPAPMPPLKHRNFSEDAEGQNLDSNSHHAIGNIKSSHINDPHLMEYMQTNLANEIGSPRSLRATAVSPHAANHLEIPTLTETPTPKGHRFVAADFFPQSLLSEDPIHKFDSLRSFTKLVQLP